MGRQYKLVIVEDQAQICEGLSKYFQNYNLGFEVVQVFSNGADAFEWLKGAPDEVDVVFTDIKMPRLTGIQLAQKIREAGWNMKIVFLSSYRDFEFAKNALNLGVNAYLTKPIQFDELDEVFANLKKFLDKEQLSQRESKTLKEEFISQIFLDIYSGVFDKKEKLLSKLSRAYISEEFIQQPYTEIVIVKPMDKNERSWNYGEERFDNFIINTLRDDTINLYIISSTEKSLCLLAVAKRTGCGGTAEFQQEVEKNVEKAKNMIQEIANIVIQVERIVHYESLIDFMECCYNAKNLIESGVNTEIEHAELKWDMAMRKAVKYIQENYNKDISVENVSEKLGISSASFGKLFKDYTGKHFVDYLIHIRLSKAEDALKNSTESIREISEMVGYRDEKYFMRIFKKKTGKTPKEYREEA